MKHGTNGVGVSMSKCRNFHKNTRNFTEPNKSLKTNLILKKKVVPHSKRGTHWAKHLTPSLFCKNVVLLRNYIVSKIKNIPPTGNVSKKKIKNKKRKECRIDQFSSYMRKYFNYPYGVSVGE